MNTIDTFPKQFTYAEARGHLTYCDSYSRLPTLLEMDGLLDDADFLRLLGEEWSGFDNLGLYVDELWDTPFMWWDHSGPIKEMMTPEELDAYNALPDAVTVYRGCYKINKWGWSWSLSKDVAEKFPTLLRYRRVGEQALLVTAMVPNKHIIAVKLDRNESEIITWRPKHVSTRHIKEQQKCRASGPVLAPDPFDLLFAA